MHRSFIDFAAVGICDQCACHDRSYRRKREKTDEYKNDPVKNPWETFSRRQGWRGHCRGCVLFKPSVYPVSNARSQSCWLPEPCCLKYFVALFFKPSWVGKVASGACSPALSPIAYAARSSAVLP